MDNSRSCYALQRYLESNIPISKALGAIAREVLPDRVTLETPLEPNLNHQGSIFGGSASAVAILAGWSLIHVRLQSLAEDFNVLIQRNEIDYLHPIDQAFRAEASLAPETDWEHFMRTLRRKKKARAHVCVNLLSREIIAARFRGSYVVLHV